MTEAIEKQVERFAPGFRERILARHIMNTKAMEELNSNYVGGDIGGGAEYPFTIIYKTCTSFCSLQEFGSWYLSLLRIYASRWGSAWNVRLSCC